MLGLHNRAEPTPPTVLTTTGTLTTTFDRLLIEITPRCVWCR